MTTNAILNTYWHEHYIAAARQFSIAKKANLGVGWKISRLDGTTHGDYYWRPVNGDHDEPILHVAPIWNEKNQGSCPQFPGDGLCLVTDSVQEASSGGVPLAHSLGHVLVYPLDDARSDTAGKWRVPWAIDVDCFDPEALVRDGFVSNLRSANLCSANLRFADLRSADLCFADLRFANLCSANLRFAYLYSADLRFARANAETLWPSGFDAKAAGVVFDS